MKRDLKTFDFCVMRSLCLGTNVRVRSFIHYVLLKQKKEVGEEEKVTEFEADTHNLHILCNALEVVTGLNTLRVTERVGKQPLFILVDSGSTHNFINSQVANRLHFKLTNIRPLTVQVIDSGIMTYTSVCKNFQWLV
jgi:hypothetical protein